MFADVDPLTAAPGPFVVGAVIGVVVPCGLVEAPEGPMISLDLDDTSEDAVDVVVADPDVKEAGARETGPSATGFLKVFGTQTFI